MRNQATIALIALIHAAAGCGGGNSQGTDSAAPVAPVEEEAAGRAASACSSDADCVPAECCHPRTCTHKDSAPDCRDTMCTMDCRAGTMDCGGGRCVCVGGKCEAEIFPPKKPRILSDPPPPPMPGSGD